MAIIDGVSTHNRPKPDKRKNRLGRFEIVVRHRTLPTPDPEVLKVVSEWHTRWRADGNLRIVSTSETLTSKRNAERSIASEAGVHKVHQDNDKLWAVLADGSRREIRILDER